MTTLTYSLLFLASAIYAIILERFKHLWEPELTWLEVVFGTALCLMAPFILRLQGVLTSANDYETAVWWSFVIGGSPVILWQLWRIVRARHERMQYTRRSRYADTAETLAE